MIYCERLFDGGAPKHVQFSLGILAPLKRSCQFLSPENHSAIEQPKIDLHL